MEITRLKSNLADWERILIRPAFASVLLAVICLGLHHSALSGGWRYDDGPHLYFAARYSPWQYFFVPEIMREQSWAHFTPWNVFFYEIGLPFFGLNPMGHYAHLLLVIWLTAVATFFLLRLWLPSLYALMAAILFLAMPATGAVAQMLMTGHYAYGLFFSVLAFYFFTRSIRENRIYFSFLAAGLYALACWCKELYVPIIGILLFLPESNWRVRLRHLWLTILVAFVYTVYRLVVLEGIGGYGSNSLAAPPAVTDIFLQLSSGLFGNTWIGNLILAYLCASVIIVRKQRINLLFLLIVLVVSFIPISSMLQADFSEPTNLRLLFFVSWSLTVILICITSLNKAHVMTLVFVILALAFYQQKTAVKIASDIKSGQQLYRFLIEGSSESVLLQPKNINIINANSMRSAKMILEHQTPPSILRDEEELIRLVEKNLESKVYWYTDRCQCIEQMGKQYYDHIHKFHAGLATGADQFFKVSFEIVDQGDLRKIIRWKFSGNEIGSYDIRILEFGVFDVPATGEWHFGFDATCFEKKDIHLRVYLHSPEGWIARSPVFTIDPTISSQVSWSGKSVLD